MTESGDIMKPYIEFPYLGLKFNIDRVAFELFGIPVYWYGIIIALGVILGVLFACYIAKKNNLTSDNIIDVVLYGLPVCVIFARIYYVIFQWDSYKGDILEIINIRNGGIAIYGAIIGGILTGYVYCKVKKIKLMQLGDAAAFGLLTGQIIGRWGNFFNQEAFGTNTVLPWGMTGSQIIKELEYLKNTGINVDPTLPVHPTFLYESLWNFCVLILLYIIFTKYHKFDGIVFYSYIVLYGVGRFFIEGLRTDSLMFLDFRVSQIVAILCVLAGLSLILFNLYIKKTKKCHKSIEISL